MIERYLKVLVLEDIEEDHELIRYTLKKAGLHFQTKRVDTREDFIDALRTYDPDVILSDHSLPQFNSLDALELCHRNKIQVPFILVTGAVSEEFAVTIIKQGADNYVLKSNLMRLPTAINGALKQRETEIAKQKANEALAVQNEELTKINKELDSFVYSVSHNLKAPLMSVLGLLTLAKMEDEKHGNIFTQYFSMMEKSIHRLDDTLKEIIDYSRNARKEVNVERIDLSKIINDNLEKMKYMPGAESVSKKVFIDEEYPLFSDGYRLSVIFNNLISNAIKYADVRKDEPYLQISIYTNKERATIEFEDNGIGIDKEYLPKVFNMFFRATSKRDGAGLGLYIVKEAVEKLGGSIEIKSEPGKGTAFYIELVNHHHEYEEIKEIQLNSA